MTTVTKRRTPPAPPQMTLYWQAEIRNTKTGKLRRRTRKRVCRSFVGNYLTFINRMFRGASITMTDIGGTGRTINTNDGNSWNLNSTAGDATNGNNGIVVGTGTTTPAGTDTKLVTIIGDGSSTGQLVYGANTNTGGMAVGASIVSFDITRSFGNSSGGTITVEEIGIDTVHIESGGPNFRVFLLVRDITGGIAVLDGETLTVTYTFKTTV